MKFSNFVSTLAAVCLAFNADAISFQKQEMKGLQTDEQDMSWAFRNAKMEEEALSDAEAIATCKYGIDNMIKPTMTELIIEYNGDFENKAF